MTQNLSLKNGRVLSSDRQSAGDFKTIDTSNLSNEWVSFVSSAIKHTPKSGFAQVELSVLVHENNPVAWMFTSGPIAGRTEKESGDARRLWLAFSRHAQSRCSDNRGMAIIKATVYTHGGRPIIWTEASVTRLFPMEAATPEGKEVILKIMLPHFIRGTEVMPS